MARLDGKVALITGAAGGIGRATAEMMVREGARVMLTDVRETEVAAVAEGLGEAATARTQDVTDEQGWIDTIAATVAAFGKLNVLVNNAGVGLPKNVEDTTLEEWRFIHAVNAEGPFLGTKYALPKMRAAGEPGSIVNVSSVAGLIGGRNLAAYCSAKGAVRLLTKSVALHCAEKGMAIRCNSVHPSFTRTDMVEGLFKLSPEPGRVEAALISEIPMGRLGEAREVAAAIVFLASDEASMITGAEMPIDGGATAR